MSTDDEQTPNLGGNSGRPSKAALTRKEAELQQREREIEAREGAVEAANREAAEQEDERLGKNARRPTAQVREPRHGENRKAARRPMGQHRRLDVDKYVERYPEHKLMLINDVNGDVQRWIDEGAEPVEAVSRGERVFEGITDKGDSKWVRFIGGDDGFGNVYYVYLLKIDPDRYHEIKIAPQRERQALIKRSMRAGRDRSGSGDGQGGSGLESYAPYLPTGERGYDEPAAPRFPDGTIPPGAGPR